MGLPILYDFDYPLLLNYIQNAFGLKNYRVALGALCHLALRFLIEHYQLVCL